jgi:hypothetical protein
VIITVIAVLMMKSTIDNVINMVSMLYCLMPTARSVHMPTARVHRMTSIRIVITQPNNMFIAMITVWMMQGAIH